MLILKVGREHQVQVLIFRLHDQTEVTIKPKLPQDLTVYQKARETDSGCYGWQPWRVPVGDTAIKTFSEQLASKPQQELHKSSASFCTLFPSFPSPSSFCISLPYPE
jgi:hypothetical protein